MATRYRFLTAAHVQRLYKAFVLQGAPTQPNLLESAIASPMNIKHYEGQTNLFQLAASLSTKIILNHAFPDGNKRAGLVAADMFLKINGYRLQTVVFADDDNNTTLASAHRAVATGQWTTEQLGAYYESIAKENEPSPQIQEFYAEATEY